MNMRPTGIEPLRRKNLAFAVSSSGEMSPRITTIFNSSAIASANAISSLPWSDLRNSGLIQFQRSERYCSSLSPKYWTLT